MPTDEVIIAEAAAGGRLTGNEPFDDVRRRMTFKQLGKNKASFDRLAGGVETFVKDSYNKQSNAKTKLIGELKARNARPARATRQWWTNAEGHIEEWVSDYLAKFTQRLGLSEDKSTWPPPRSQQTLWALYSSHMARVALTVGESWEVDDGDLHDANHYATACYADAFVVQDKGSRKTIRLIPSSPVEVLSFDEFAAELGVAPH
jgi:hypothetical protein